MRDEKWLNNKMCEIWDNHFSDVEKQNEVMICYGRRARRRLGYIKLLDHKDPSSPTKITVNGFFKDLRVPEEVIKVTIAHEICHYTHGFCSPLPKLYDQPHAGGVVEKEMQKRGLDPDLKKQFDWMTREWEGIVCELPRRKRRSKRPKTVLTRLIRSFGA